MLISKLLKKFVNIFLKKLFAQKWRDGYSCSANLFCL
jgi:hypothetical protein